MPSTNPTQPPALTDHHCPFYGGEGEHAHGVLTITLHPRGTANTCALQGKGTPCVMQARSGATPDWNECTACNGEAAREGVPKILATGRISLPGTPRTTVPLKQYFREVMGDPAAA